MLKRIGMTCLLIAAVGTPLAIAHEGATGLAKERMDSMEAMGKEAKEIARKISGNRNLASIADHAAKIGQTAVKIPSLFPTGSGTGVTAAKPIIWQEWDKFQAQAKQVEQASANLATAASSGDPKLIRMKFVEMERGCNACHDQFRAKGH